MGDAPARAAGRDAVAGVSRRGQREHAGDALSEAGSWPGGAHLSGERIGRARARRDLDGGLSAAGAHNGVRRGGRTGVARRPGPYRPPASPPLAPPPCAMCAGRFIVPGKIP